MGRKRYAAIILSVVTSFALIPSISVSATQADDLINIAMGELHNTDGTKYGTSGAWCAHFIVWCADQANIPTSVLPRIYKAEAYRSEANYHARGTYSPKRGDIVLLDWDLDNIADHAEIVAGVHSDGVYTIGGNTSLSGNSSVNGVETKTRYNYKSWGQILGYFEVIYPSTLTVNLSPETYTSTTATRANGTIEVQTTISNLSQSASYVAAVYDSSGKLLGQTTNDVDSATQSLTTYLPNYSNASYIKVYLWNSLNGMKPLTDGEKVSL